MKNDVTALDAQLVAQLQHEKLVLLHTIDHESGAPTSSAISWVTAPNEGKLRIALDQRSRLVANLKQNPKASVTIFALHTVHVVYGQAVPVHEHLPEVPIKLACFDIQVETVRDGMFYGARIATEPEYEKIYDKRAAQKLDTQVFQAMNKA